MPVDPQFRIVLLIRYDITPAFAALLYQPRPPQLVIVFRVNCIPTVVLLAETASRFPLLPAAPVKRQLSMELMTPVTMY